MAIRDIDWSELEHVLGNRKCMVIQPLHAGHGTNQIATALKVSAPRVTQIKREIVDVILERWGECSAGSGP